MRLYSLVGAIAHDDPEYGHFVPDPEDGSFPFPDDISDLIAGSAVKGRKLWETEEQRAERMHGLEMARRRDPASMLSAMEDNQALVRQLAELTAHLATGQLGGAPAAAEPAVAALTEQVKALTAKLAEMEARSASPDPEGGQDETGAGAAKSARTRKAADPKAGPAAS